MELLVGFARCGVATLTVEHSAEKTRTSLAQAGAGAFHLCVPLAFDAEAGTTQLLLADGPTAPGAVIADRDNGHEGAIGPLVTVSPPTTDAAPAMRVTGIAGLAAPLLRSGALATLGPLWSVPEAPLATFHGAFQDALAQGDSLGRAVHAGRAAVRDGGDPHWLAFALFGDPSTRITLGKPGAPMMEQSVSD